MRKISVAALCWFLAGCAETTAGLQNESAAVQASEERAAAEEERRRALAAILAPAPPAAPPPVTPQSSGQVSDLDAVVAPPPLPAIQGNVAQQVAVDRGARRRAFLVEHRDDVIPALSALRCARERALRFVERANRSYRSHLGQEFDDEKRHRSALHETDEELAMLRAKPMPCDDMSIKLLMHCLKSVESMGVVVGAPSGGPWCHKEPYATWASLDAVM